jgi:hypothetical protein
LLNSCYQAIQLAIDSAVSDGKATSAFEAEALQLWMHGKFLQILFFLAFKTTWALP